MQRANPSERPTRLEVDLGNLRKNARALSLAGQAPLWAVVKANAYGLGSKRIAQTLEPLDCIHGFAVATLNEGLALRRAGREKPILVVGPLQPQEISIALDHRVDPAIFSLASLQCAEGWAKRSGQRVGIHLKVDTGMGRLGFLPQELGALISNWKSRFPSLQPLFLFSNLACSDQPNHPLNSQQIRTLTDLRDGFKALGVTPRLHLANSGAIHHVKGALFSVLRPGLSLYGIPPGPRADRVGLAPVTRFVSSLSQTKTLPPDHDVGYGATYRTREETTVGLVPAGYADGIPRALSNKGFFTLKNHKAPILGRVSMDLTVIQIPPGTPPGTPVTIFGDFPTPWAFSEWAQTIPYEVLCHISARVPRVYHG